MGQWNNKKKFTLCVIEEIVNGLEREEDVVWVQQHEAVHPHQCRPTSAGPPGQATDGHRHPFPGTARRLPTAACCTPRRGVSPEDVLAERGPGARPIISRHLLRNGVSFVCSLKSSPATNGLSS